MIRNARAVVLLGLLSALGCHTDAFLEPRSPTDGPLSRGADVQLTYSDDQDYWPIWTQDGRGILYAFVDVASVRHRCLGLMPAGGGTRIWQLCDNRFVRNDTLSSYGAFALDSSGRLLFTEATAPATVLELPPVTKLWLADTATPYLRTRLITFPVVVDGVTINWLADLRWTGPNTFIALAQQFETKCHRVDFLVHDPVHGDRLATQCPTRDTLYADGFSSIVKGAITQAGATLERIAGTDSASGYSLAENGASIVFIVPTTGQLFRIPVTGGVRTAVIPRPPHVGPLPEFIYLLGVSCRLSTCVFAADSIGDYGVDNYFGPLSEVQLQRVSLLTGAVEAVFGNRQHVPYSTPQVSPVNGDVVLQLGGGFGHSQTYSTVGIGYQIIDVRNSVLHLYSGVLP